MTRPTRAEIIIPALQRNLELVSRSASKGSIEPPVIIPVVKANAYGHGAVEISRHLLDSGIKWLAVACLEEALDLAGSGAVSPEKASIIILGPVFKDEIEEIVRQGFVPVISDPSDVEKIEAGCKSRKGLRAIIYLDTGMGRTGVVAEDLNELCGRAKKIPGLEIVGIFSHFPVADGVDEEDCNYTQGQIQDFQLLSRSILTVFPACRLVSIANSSGIFYHPDSVMNAVRPGICMYGVRPASDLEEPRGLHPVMRWTTEIAQIRGLPAGASVSYGRKTVLKRPSRLALLPAGYADGLNRRLPPGFAFSVRGRAAPLTGVVTMDLTVIDVTDIPDARPGDRVLLMGRENTGGKVGTAEDDQAFTEVPAEVHARETGTIPYEILTSVGPRVKRVYLEED